MMKEVMYVGSRHANSKDYEQRLIVSSIILEASNFKRSKYIRENGWAVNQIDKVHIRKKSLINNIWSMRNADCNLISS